MTDDTEPTPDTRLPGLTVQRTTPVENLLARLEGTLYIDPSTNCLVIRMPANHTEILLEVAWPPGWTVAIRDNRPALIDATGQTAAHVGDEVSLGGGSVDTTRANVNSCAGQDHVFVAWTLSRL